MPASHSSRRASALACLRHGIDMYGPQKLMGYADLSVLWRCLAQDEAGLQTTHARAGPVDRVLRVRGALQ